MYTYITTCDKFYQTSASFSNASNKGQVEGQGTGLKKNYPTGPNHVHFMCYRFSCQIFSSYYNGMWTADMNECTSGIHGCNLHATCHNTQGSYTCSCNRGYTGNGFTCTGIVYIMSVHYNHEMCHHNHYNSIRNGVPTILLTVKGQVISQHNIASLHSV